MNNLAIIYALVLLCIVSIISLITFDILIFNILKEMKQKRNLEQLKINLDYKITDDDFSLLDKLLGEVFQQYQILNIELLEKDYVNEETQKKMIEDLLRMVLTRISPIYMNKLSYIYNVDHIEDIILEKIRIIVIDYSVENNNNLE